MAALTCVDLRRYGAEVSGEVTKATADQRGQTRIASESFPDRPWGARVGAEVSGEVTKATADQRGQTRIASESFPAR